MSSSDGEDRGYLSTVILALPLLTVVVVMVYALLPREMLPFEVRKNDYPIRIDLNDVDRAVYTEAGATGEGEPEIDPAVAEIAAQLANEDRTADTQFEAVFRGMLGRQDAKAPDRSGSTAAVAVSEGGVMDIDFDLAAGPQSDNTIQLRMDVQLGQRVLGPVEIRIDNNSSIYVAREEMLALLPETVRGAERLEGDFVELASLRDAGVNLRYDAVSDRLVLVQ